MNGIVESMFRTGTLRHRRFQTNRSMARMRRAGVLQGEIDFQGNPHFDIRGSVRIGADFTIDSQPIQTHIVVVRGGHLEIGNRVSLSGGCGIACHSHVSIGDGTKFGLGVLILDSDYHVAGDPHGRPIASPIAIGRNVYVGARSVILRGTIVGDGAHIEADSVVSGVVPANSRVGGVPAKDVSASAAQDGLPASFAVEMETEARVLALAQDVFQLSALPKLSDGPLQIERWDSLGSLTFLLSLEQVFRVSLDVDDASGVRTLADVSALVQETLSSA